jgi:hypothetical protein
VGSPHPEGDWVDLHPVATIDVGAAAHIAIAQFGSDAMRLQVALGHAWLWYGIAAWSFVGEDGPVPVRPDDPGWAATVDRWLPFRDGGRDVVERANDLYEGDVIRPLALMTSGPSQDGQTAPSTSAEPTSGSESPTPSVPSSPTPTDGKPSEDPAP